MQKDDKGDRGESLEPLQKKLKSSDKTWEYTKTVKPETCQSTLTEIINNHYQSVKVRLEEVDSSKILYYRRQDVLNRYKEEYNDFVKNLVLYASQQQIVCQIMCNAQYLSKVMKIFKFEHLETIKNYLFLSTGNIELSIPHADQWNLLNALQKNNNQDQFKSINLKLVRRVNNLITVVSRCEKLINLTLEEVAIQHYNTSVRLIKAIMNKADLNNIQINRLIDRDVSYYRDSNDYLKFIEVFSHFLQSLKQSTKVYLVLRDNIGRQERIKLCDLLNRNMIKAQEISINMMIRAKNQDKLEMQDVFYDYKKTQEFVERVKPTDSYDEVITVFPEYKLDGVYPGVELSRYNFKPDTIDAIIAWIQSNNKIEAIRIIDNHTFTDEYAQKLILAIKDSKQIIKLTLSRMKLSEKAMNAVSILLNNNILAFLDISSNKFDNDDLHKLAKIMEQNSSLIMLDVSGNNFTAPALTQFIRILRKNNTLTIFGYIDSKKAINSSTAQELIVAFDETKTIRYRKKSRTPPGIRNFSLISIDIPTLSEKNTKSVEARFQKFISENKKLKQDLMDTARSGEFKNFKEKLEKKVSCYICDQGNYLMHVTVKFGHIKLLKELLKRRVNPLIRNREGQTALELAQQLNREEMIKILQNPSSYQQPDLSLPPSAKLVSPKKQKQKKKLLVKRKTPEKPKSPATIKGKELVESDDEVVEVLKKQKTIVPTVAADLPSGSPAVAIPTDIRTDFFFQAIHNGNVTQIKKFFNKSLLQVNYGTKGEQALHCAVAAMQLESVKLLLELGANLESKSHLGFTPLALCVKLINEVSDGDEKITIKLNILRLLIIKGVNVNYAYNSDDYGEITPLMQTVIDNNYRTMKLIANVKDCNFAWSNDEGLDVLKLIIQMQRTDFLNRLLIMPRVENSLITNTREWLKRFTSDNEVYYKKIKKLLERRLRLKVPDNHAGIQWKKNLKLVWKYDFYEKTSLFCLDGASAHEHLFAQNSLSRARLERHNEDNESESSVRGNTVTASISFVIAIPMVMHKKQIREVRINLDFTTEFHVGDAEHDEDELDRIKRRIQLGYSKDYENYRGDKHVPCDVERLDELYKEDENHTMFDQWFHHGEASLITHLESNEFIQALVAKLKSHKDYQPSAKVLALILDLFTFRYTCSNCEIALLSNQHQLSLFMTKLQKQLQNNRIKTPVFHPLPAITRISTIEAFESDPMPIEQHGSFIVDLRCCDNNVILSKDILAEDPKLTQYQSRGN